MGVGLEIIDWITDGGESVFVDEFLKPLGLRFQEQQRTVYVNRSTIRVNLNVPPKLPFDGAEIEVNNGDGWVTVQKRSGELYVDGCRVKLYLSEDQKDGKIIQGDSLLQKIKDKRVLHPNILDALMDFPYLIPMKWKDYHIYFCGVIFRGPEDSEVRICFLHRSGTWREEYNWLNEDFGSNDFVAYLE